MKIKHTSVLFLTLLGATAGYSQITLNPVPARAIGQSILVPESANPNLVEGRELYSPQGIAVDNSATPPIVYVADTGNNRVLAWKNAATFSNGAMADLVIGQPDKYSTVPYGPLTTFSTGLNSPTGLAVYKSDLYVVDSGNNRVLRYPKPFSQTGQVFPDLYVGQPSLNSRVPDQPNGLVSALGIYTASTSAVFVANIAFDSAGNLWMTDPGNRRVLRFPAAAIAKGGGGLTADIEIGQVDFVSAQANLSPTNVNSQLVTNQFAVPYGIAFDAAGNLYVSDSDLSGTALPGRVLVFTAASLLPGSYISAARIMGVLQQSASGATITQSQIDHTVMIYPQGIFMLPGNQGIGVVDSQSSRILIFDPYTATPAAGSSWDPNTSFSPQAKTIIGQPTPVCGTAAACRAANNGNPAPSASTLAYPVAVALAGTDLLIADSGNNRVIGMPQQGGAYVSTMSANRVLGQDYMNTFSINLIEGREFAFVSQNAQGSCADAGLAIDSTGDTPHLYVADPCNNRVLGFKDARKLKPGATADIVIGQPDMHTALCNYPSGNLNQPGQSNLCGPIGLLVDSGGNLYVADSGNGRVLRFPTPFGQQSSSLQPADRVVGQAGFYSKVTDPSPSTMAAPYGLALSGINGLLVSDVKLNRVLYFPMANGDLTSPEGETATKVFGQPDFVTIVKGTDDTSMSAPRHVAADSSGRLYVADTGNNRVMIFGDPHDPNTASADAHALQPIITGISAPRGVYVSLLTGEIWVTDTGNTSNPRCLRYPSFEQYFVTGTYNGSVPAYGATLAVIQDQYGDLLVADAANRVEFYYPGLAVVNAASSVPAQALAPGVFASIYPAGVTFGTNTIDVGSLPNPVPFPTVLGDTQVLFNGQPAPVKYVSPGQINFIVPMNAPTSGTADVQVVRQSTGQILTDGLVAMNAVSPAIFAGGQVNCSLAGGKCRQASVVNDADGTVNTPANPAAAGSYISIYATGQGFVQGAPSDGDIPRSGLVQTSVLPKVFINACYVDDASCTGETGVENVQFSGLSPQFPGVWQINVRIPKNTGGGTQVPLVVVMNNYTSQTALTANYYTTIAVKNQ
jgi:uncharacterized protein (TIGR03437 family)